MEYEFNDGSHRNYLRVRGEYYSDGGAYPSNTELPPRARRIHVLVSSKETPRGTTSACAENTLETSVLLNRVGNYLRVRGEYLYSIVYTDSR